jgi:hypothetical protein
MAVEAPTSVTPLSAEVEGIYGELEVLSVQVEALRQCDSSVHGDERMPRPEAAGATSKEDAQVCDSEARQIREDVDHLRTVIVRLRETLPDSSAVSGSRSQPATHESTPTGVTESEGERGGRQPQTNSVLERPFAASSSSLSPLELLRCLAMLRAEIDEYIGQMQLQDVNIERLPSYKSHRASHMHLMGFRASPAAPLVPPLPVRPLPQPACGRVQLRAVNADVVPVGSAESV